MTALTQFLQSIRDRAAAATKGPWGAYGADGTVLKARTPQGNSTLADFGAWEGPEQDKLNITFIAHARDDVPALVKMLEVAVEALARQKTVLEKQQCDCCIGNEAGHVVRCSRCWSLDDIDSALAKLQAMVPGEGQ